MTPHHMYRELEKAGVTESQFRVMEVLSRQPQRRSAVAVEAYEDSRWDPFAAPHCEDYLIAIDQCVENGWLHIVSLQEVKARRSDRAAERIPSCVDTSINFLDLDFTPKGYQLHRELLFQVSKSQRTGLRFLDTEHGRVLEVYGEDKESCQAYAELQLRNQPAVETGPWGDDGSVIRSERVSVSAPLEVGPWRYSRFEVVPEGFCIAIVYSYTRLK